MRKIDKILTTLGTNNSSQIATAVLAGFKMFFLPIATATDKNASTEQKTYTIIRDIIMEGLALITYIGVTGQIQKHVTAPICRAYYKNKAKGKYLFHHCNRPPSIYFIKALRYAFSFLRLMGIITSSDKMILPFVILL